MIQVTDLKAGTTFELKGKPYKVYKYTHTKLGRGGANVKVSVRNLETGALEEKTFGSDEKVEEISTVKKTLQFLYKSEDSATFMDTKTYEQIEIPAKIIENELAFIKDGQSVSLLFWEDEVLSVDIAPKVELEITETAPGVKGNSATNVYKSAKLENGMELKVPLFIKNGDRVIVDTRTGEYVERAK